MIKYTITDLKKSGFSENVANDDDMNNGNIEVVTSPDGKCQLIKFKSGTIMAVPFCLLGTQR